MTGRKISSADKRACRRAAMFLMDLRCHYLTFRGAMSRNRAFNLETLNAFKASSIFFMSENFFCHTATLVKYTACAGRTVQILSPA